MYGSQNLLVFGFQPSGGGSSTPVNTIYNADDTILGDRILNANGNTVTFLDTSVFRINTSINPIASRATFQVDGVGTTSSISVEKISSQLGVARETYADKTQQFYGNIGINANPDSSIGALVSGSTYGGFFAGGARGAFATSIIGFEGEGTDRGGLFRGNNIGVEGRAQSSLGVGVYAWDGGIIGAKALTANGQVVFNSNGSVPVGGNGSFTLIGYGNTSSDIVEKISSDLGITRESYGDNSQQFYGNLGINTTVSNNSAIKTSGTLFGGYFTSGLYGVYGATVNGYADYLSTGGGNVIHGYYASQIPLSSAFKVENPTGGSGGFKTAFKADSYGDNIGGYNEGFIVSINALGVINRGFSADVLGGTNNYAFEIVSGDFKTPSGIGLSGTFTFGGGSTGDIASLTFENGILIGRTVV